MRQKLLPLQNPYLVIFSTKQFFIRVLCAERYIVEFMKQVKYTVDKFLTEMIQIAENIYDRYTHLKQRNSTEGEMRIRG